MATVAWNLLTLDATKILYNLTKRHIVQQNGNYKVRFQYDLSEQNALGRDIIMSEDLFADNAFFFQLRKILPAENALRSFVVFVDFKEIFLKEDLAPINLSRDIPPKDELLSENALGYRMRVLFEDGLFLSFDGKNFQRFVPFDKSNSMAHKCQITFIDAQFKDAFDKRLMLDMDFWGMRLSLSKFYSYRGLYLSDGFRIDEIEKFPLNAETVVVLPDFNFSLVQNTFTASKVAEQNLWEYKHKEKPLTLNLFDGEGLICPEFAQYLSDFLRTTYNFVADSHSFQIRLPFTKGVLHEVDFNKFFSEQLPVFVDNLLVEDVFGITRDLRKAKIILTKSMFKCTGWIKNSSNFNSDPMQYFFDKFAEYDHALYVTNTEARLSNPGYINLNHQFLSTLALTDEDLNSLVNEHIHKIETFHEKFIEEIKNPTVNTTCLRAVSKNSAFLQDPKVKNIYENMRKNQEFNLGLGELEIEGEQRFLSCDLLSLLVRILSAVKNIELDESVKNSLEQQCLYVDHFFMPENKLPMIPDKHYVFLRNPHLSRNEQVLLRAYVKRATLYEKYFSHLRGVVMISAKSTAAMALGGADFDGDLVKITSDSRIVKAVKHGNVDCNLPPIEIPSNKGKLLPLSYSIPLEVIVDTFANKIGQVSDLAVKLSQSEYHSKTVEEFLENACAKCTIVVGLEIDAAKTGNHPDENIVELKELAGKCDKSIFMESKKVLEQLLEWQSSPCVVHHGNSLFLYSSKKAKENGHSKLTLSETEGQFLDRLPVRYLKFLLECKSRPSLPTGEQKQCFKFEVAGWRKELDKNLRDKLKLLIKAYLHILSLNRKRQYIKNFTNQTKFSGHVINILRLQYDDLHQKLPCGVEIADALNQLYAALYDHFENAAEVKKALNELKNKQWHLTCAEDRPKVAAEILGFSRAEELPSVAVLLFNFRCNGFMLFYFILTEVQRRFFEDSDLLDQNNSSDENFAPDKNPYYEELYRVYSDSVATKKTKTIWNKALINICRRHLAEDFGADNFKDALKYFWSQRSEDSGRNFLWNVFKAQEIFDQIYIEEPAESQPIC